MTQEQKELLIKDLCGRLPYGVILQIGYGTAKGVMEYKDEIMSPTLLHDIMTTEYSHVKPYLRPMESMTEKEKKEWHATFESVYDLVPGGDPDNEDDYDDNCHEEPGIESYDYLISHHFDYRGLIPMGLALPAPEGMYK